MNLTWILDSGSPDLSCSNFNNEIWGWLVPHNHRLSNLCHFFKLRHFFELGNFHKSVIWSIFNILSNSGIFFNFGHFSIFVFFSNFCFFQICFFQIKPIYIAGQISGKFPEDFRKISGQISGKFQEAIVCKNLRCSGPVSVFNFACRISEINQRKMSEFLRAWISEGRTPNDAGLPATGYC